MTHTILVVDDEPNLTGLVRAYLEQDGFHVVIAHDGRAALFLARDHKPDLIVLDVMMPELDGYDFMRLHRKERNTPIILLTARVEDSDKIVGLELGADDYVAKPFSPRELVARVRAVLRRAAPQLPGGETLHVGEIMLDRNAHSVKLSTRAIELTPAEFDLLAVLMSAPGRAFTRLELLERVQGTTYDGYERTIDAHIKNLRGKLEPDPRHPRYIETVYGVGYRCAEEA